MVACMGLVLSAAADSGSPDRKCKKLAYRPPCPDGKIPKEGEDCAVAIDPAFITYDAVRTTMISVTASNKEGDGLSGSNEAVKELMQAMGQAKTPEQARTVAAEAWRMKVTLALQRHALVLAKTMDRTPTGTETLDFMLAALDAPSAELERCREWSRGSALEKRKAADHLALLLQNPNLADRLQ